MTYQKILFDKMQAGGFKQGELMLFTAGRQTGKSMLNQMYGSMTTPNPKFKILEQAMVDGDQWYTVGCTKEVSEWINTQPKEWRQEHIDDNWHFSLNRFDIHEKLYTLLALRWT